MGRMESFSLMMDDHDDRRSRWERFLPEFRRGLAETIGTFTLVLVACLGSASPHTSTMGKAVAEGMTIAALVFAIGQVSGAHFNPATSVAFSLRLAFEWWRLLYYVPAQCFGAMMAALVVRGILGAEGENGASIAEEISSGRALGMTVLFSALFFFIVLTVSERARIVGPNAALAVGMALIAFISVGGPLGGLTNNPARSVAPALLARGEALEQLWIFVVGPFVGAIIAVLLTCMLGSQLQPEALHKAMGMGRIGPENLEEGIIESRR